MPAFFVLGRGSVRVRYTGSMRISTAHYVDGKLLVDGVPLPDGVVVTILQPEDDSEAVSLSPQDEEELVESVEQIRKGRWISGDELLESLKPHS